MKKKGKKEKGEIGGKHFILICRHVSLLHKFSKIGGWSEIEAEQPGFAHVISRLVLRYLI